MLLFRNEYNKVVWPTIRLTTTPLCSFTPLALFTKVLPALRHARNKENHNIKKKEELDQDYVSEIEKENNL